MASVATAIRSGHLTLGRAFAHGVGIMPTARPKGQIPAQSSLAEAEGKGKIVTVITVITSYKVNGSPTIR